MSLNVKTLEVGPIVGHTTEYGFRIWGKAPSFHQSEEIVGVVKIWRDDAIGFEQVRVFNFIKEYDNSGIVDFGVVDPIGTLDTKLEPNTVYNYMIGYVLSDSAEQLQLALNADADELDWDIDDVPTQKRMCGEIKTFPGDSPRAITRFIVGSCRDKWGDKGEETFNTIYNYIMDENSKPDFILMTGDQIYIDHVNVKKFRPDLEQYWKEYRESFALHWFSRVVSNLPVYMALDDHEIQNNFTREKFIENRDDLSDENRKFHKQTLQYGQRAYEAYQVSYSPLVKSYRSYDFGVFTELDRGPKYWYSYTHGACDFFVMNIRGESEILENKQEEERMDYDPAIIGIEQKNALEAWLVNSSGNVKFIASGLPVFPDTRGAIGSPGDKWLYASKQRLELLDFIRENREICPKVVFLSGDVHVSFVSQLTHPSDTDFKIYSVVSSAFNWYVLGLSSSNFIWDKLIAKKPKVKDIDTDVIEYSDYVVSRYPETKAPDVVVEDDDDVFDTKFYKPKVHKRNNFAFVEVDNNKEMGKAKVCVKFIRGKDNELLEEVWLDF